MIISETYEPAQSSQSSHLLLVKEKSSPYTHHDLLFKKLIQTFFIEFIEAFFPELYEEIDFKSIKHLSEEMIANVYDGDKRILDIVVEVKWKKIDTIIVIHVEPQSYQQSDFNKRMFHYFSLLYRKLDKPIIPIAVFSYDEAWDKDEFEMTIGDLDVFRFKYLTLHLRKMDWHHFIRKENPVSAALMSKMGYNKRERIKVKIEFYRILTKLKINLEQRDILIGFFQTYLELSEKEEEMFVEEISKQENAEEILKIPISYEERGKAMGREEGREAVALEMLKESYTMEEIMKLTQLKREQVEQLKNKL